MKPDTDVGCGNPLPLWLDACPDKCIEEDGDISAAWPLGSPGEETVIVGYRGGGGKNGKAGRGGWFAPIAAVPVTESGIGG